MLIKNNEDKSEIEVIEVNTETGEIVEIVESETDIVFRKPYIFEGKTYQGLDLSKLDLLTGADMIAAQRVLDRSGALSFLPEMTFEYASVLVSRALKLPIEFFNSLPPRECIKVKSAVVSFLYGRE